MLQYFGFFAVVLVKVSLELKITVYSFGFSCVIIIN